MMRPIGDVTVSFCISGATGCRRMNESNEDGEVQQSKTVIGEHHRHKQKVREWNMAVERVEDIPAARKGAIGLTKGQLVQAF